MAAAKACERWNADLLHGVGSGVVAAGTCRLAMRQMREIDVEGMD